MRGTWIMVAAVCGTLGLSACGSDASSPPAASAPPSSSSAPSTSSRQYSGTKADDERAAEVADKFHSALEQDPSFGGLAIVPNGMRVDVVGEPSATVNSAVAGMRKFVPVTTRPVKNSVKDLMKLTRQIDADSWKAKGILLSNWGPHENSNTVRVWLAQYTPEAEQQLIAVYGTERFSVSKRSEKIASMDNVPA
jgi:hypothetical protein